jgi:hypothetical protein
MSEAELPDSTTTDAPEVPEKKKVKPSPPGFHDRILRALKACGGVACTQMLLDKMRQSFGPHLKQPFDDLHAAGYVRYVRLAPPYHSGCTDFNSLPEEERQAIEKLVAAGVKDKEGRPLRFAFWLKGPNFKKKYKPVEQPQVPPEEDALVEPAAAAVHPEANEDST